MFYGHLAETGPQVIIPDIPAYVMNVFLRYCCYSINSLCI